MESLTYWNEENRWISFASPREEKLHTIRSFFAFVKIELSTRDIEIDSLEKNVENQPKFFANSMKVRHRDIKEFLIINLLANNCQQTTARGKLAFPPVHQDSPSPLHAPPWLAQQGQGVQIYFCHFWMWTNKQTDKGVQIDSWRNSNLKVQVIYVGRNVKDICVSSFYHERPDATFSK